MPNLGAPEILIILLILVLLFGAKKLPELARGSGRALRIFKSETKGMMDDDEDDEQKPQPPQQITSTNVVQPQPVEPGQPAPAADPLPPTHTEK